MIAKEEADKLQQLFIDKIYLIASGINNVSTAESDKNEAIAINQLLDCLRTLSYLAEREEDE